MNPITIETPLTVEPIDQRPTLFELANWLSVHFPEAITPVDGPAETAQLPIIDW